jgi:hypothetical protein
LRYNPSEDRSAFSGVRNTHRRMMGIAPNGDLRPLMPPNAQTTPLANSSFGSAHVGVCQFVLCDGSVRTFPIGTPVEILTAYVTRSGGETVGDLP